jgi:hypothetical protein
MNVLQLFFAWMKGGHLNPKTLNPFSQGMVYIPVTGLRLLVTGNTSGTTTTPQLFPVANYLSPVT